MQTHASLVTTIHRSEDSRAARVAFAVDGQDLIELVRAIEVPHARRDGAEALAGNYAWPLLTARLLNHLSGETEEGVLLNCGCGLRDCWPLAMDVRVQARIVVWDRFRQLRREDRWDYRALAPLRFARAAYMQEISRLEKILKRPGRFDPSAAMGGHARSHAPGAV